MSLVIRYNKDSQTVKSGILFHGLFPSLLNTNMGTIVDIGDLLVRYLNMHRWIAPTRARSVGELFCFLNYLPYDESLTISSKPDTFKELVAHYDQLNYGSIYQNLQLFGSSFFGLDFNAPSKVGENCCRHSTYSGELVAMQADIPTAYHDHDFFGLAFKVRTWAGYTASRCTVSSVHPLVVGVQLDYGDLDVLNIYDFLQVLPGKTVNAVTFRYGGIWISNLTDFDVTYNHLGILIKYRTVLDEVLYNQRYSWDSSIRIPFCDPVLSVVPEVGLDYGTYRCDPIVFDYKILEAHPYSGPDDHLVGSAELIPLNVSLSYPLFSGSAERVRAFGIHNDFLNKRFLIPFKNAVDDNIRDITASALFSTVDAFKEAEGYLGTNVLQNLAKLPSITSALPKIKEAIDVLGKLARRDLSISTIREILDLGTSTVLQANFEWRPYISLFTTYLPMLLSTMHSLGDISENAIGHGSFRFKMSNQLGRKDVTLLTRTKIVMDTSPSGLMSAVLGFDALGLLPKASNLWDLLPFSFVANWFTGIGESIRRAEYSLLLAGIPAYFVHSYTISSPLSDDELDLIEASSSSPEPASLRLYYRDVSLYCPMPRDSKFGFGLPSGLPPSGILGSLLYQLIFG